MFEIDNDASIDELRKQRRELIDRAKHIAVRIGNLESAGIQYKRIEVHMPVSVDMRRVVNPDGTWSKWQVLGTVPPRNNDAQQTIDLMNMDE